MQHVPQLDKRFKEKLNAHYQGYLPCFTIDLGNWKGTVSYLVAVSLQATGTPKNRHLNYWKSANLIVRILFVPRLLYTLLISLIWNLFQKYGIIHIIENAIV